GHFQRKKPILCARLDRSLAGREKRQTATPDGTFHLLVVDIGEVMLSLGVEHAADLAGGNGEANRQRGQGRRRRCRWRRGLRRGGVEPASGERSDHARKCQETKNAGHRHTKLAMKGGGKWAEDPIGHWGTRCVSDTRCFNR